MPVQNSFIDIIYHALMKFKDIDKLSRNLRNALVNGNISI
jgi:hypothetical protein